MEYVNKGQCDSMATGSANEQSIRMRRRIRPDWFHTYQKVKVS